MFHLTPQQLDALSTWANIGLTFGLLVFAFMQWWVSHAGERERRRERAEDRKHEEEKAYYLLRAVWVDTLNRLHELREYDTVDLAREGRLRAESFRPESRVSLVEAAATLGIVPAHLVQSALAELQDVATFAEVLTDHARHGRHTLATKTAEQLMAALEEAELILRDAVDHGAYPGGDDRILENPNSRAGRQMALTTGTRPRSINAAALTKAKRGD